MLQRIKLVPFREFFRGSTLGLTASANMNNFATMSPLPIFRMIGALVARCAVHANPVRAPAAMKTDLND